VILQVFFFQSHAIAFETRPAPLGRESLLINHFDSRQSFCHPQQPGTSPVKIGFTSLVLLLSLKTPKAKLD
jgi:hypothetical protein